MVGREGGEEGGVVGGCGGEISLGIEKFLLKMVHNVRGQGFVVGVLVFDEGLFGGFEKSLGWEMALSQFSLTFLNSCFFRSSSFSILDKNVEDSNSFFWVISMSPLDSLSWLSMSARRLPKSACVIFKLV